MKRFQDTHELDSSVTLAGLRFRANFYKTIHGPAAVLRRVESVIPTMDQFDLPPVLYDIIDMHKGLVLVTGPTGSGKSTTLAAIVNEINKTRTSNIITVEDPVEFIHKDLKSIVSHREVGKQTQSFASALKAALREDPDVILVGEMRDLETVSLALTAAETGHLVFGTLHTSGAPSTINRIIDVFPPEQQAQIRAQISTSLKMVVTQRLLKTKDGQGRCGAFEVMKCTAPIQNLIRESKIHQIPSIMQTAVKEGMITMTKSLEELVKAGKIDAGSGKEH
jgi:twitching motility protein PilT